MNRILVVDDEPAIVAVVRERLEREGFTVQVAASGEEALAYLETNPAPVKYALSVLGKCSDRVRLPMVPVSDKTKVVVCDAMVHAGLIN